MYDWDDPMIGRSDDSVGGRSEAESDGASTKSPLLVIDSVSKRFGTVQALSHVSLDCEAGRDPRGAR